MYHILMVDIDEYLSKFEHFRADPPSPKPTQPANKPKKYKKKVVLLGDGAVGKTSLIRKFVHDSFDDKYITTIGSKVVKKELRFETPKGAYLLDLMVWDIIGQHGYRTVQNMALADVEGALIVCDLTRPETLENLEKYWIPKLSGKRRPVALIMLANKADLVEQRAIDDQALISMAARYNAVQYTTSAKTGDNVDTAFFKLGIQLLFGPGKMGRARVGKDGVATVEMEPSGAINVTDRIISDFLAQDAGGQAISEDKMSILREAFVMAGIDLNDPKPSTLKEVVSNLAQMEAYFLPKEIVQENLRRRKGWLDIIL